MLRPRLSARQRAGAMLPCSWSPWGAVGENAATPALAGTAKTSPCAIPCLSPDHIRSLFAQAMSDMYRAEVPLYGDLMALVAQVNADTLSADPALAARLQRNDERARLDLERHGAIRVGTAQELATLRRLFAVMGMHPVGYYDLSVAGVPVHSTAFRPIDEAALSANPFRVFTSLLRLELIEDAALRAQAAQILEQRQIFTAATLELIDQHERHGGLEAAQAQQFVAEALETFRWHGDATVSLPTYRALSQAHKLIADVVSFHGPHINHLTPRTLDIDAAQAQMQRAGIDAKAVIEGRRVGVCRSCCARPASRPWRSRCALSATVGRPSTARIPHASARSNSADSH